MRKQFSNERGSALVAVIAFAIIISIAAGGLLMLAANSVGNEADELDDYQALLAAESGLQMGLRWLGDTLNWRNIQMNPGTQSIGVYTINGMTVTDTVTSGVGGTILRTQATCPRMKYVKEVSCNVDSTCNFGLATNSWDPAAGRLNLDNIWFDGPAHSNAPLQMANASIPASKRGNVYFVNGPVSVTDTRTNQTSRGIGPSGNDYSYGINIENLSPDGTQGRMLDRYFDNTFAYTMDSVRMPGLVGISTLPQHSYINWSYGVMPTIYFWVDIGTNQGMYTYYYHAPLTGPTHVSQFPGTLGTNSILFSADSVRILGTIKGSVTIVTAPNMNIYPVGDLRYADFVRTDADYTQYNPQNNYGVNLTSPNYLALVAGGDIHFSAGRQKNINPADGSFTSAPAGATIFITASLYATNPGKSIRWDTTTGTGAVNLFAYQYDICAIGSRVVHQFFNYTARSDNPALANTRFRFYYDRRLGNNLRAPGVPAFRRSIPDPNNPNGPGIELYFLKTTNWREQNIAR